MNDTRRFPDFTNTLEWNLVSRQTYVAQTVAPRGYIPIPAAVWTINDTHVLLIGTRSNSAESRWFLGAWAEHQLPFTPSSTSEFTNLTYLGQVKCGLGRLTLCVFPKFSNSWILRLKFPWWLQDVSVEVWRYDGRDIDLFTPGAQQVLVSEVSQSTTPVVLLPANPSRKGAVIANNGSSRLAIELEGVPGFSSSPSILDPGSYYEVLFGFTGEVNGVWELPGSGVAEIREFL